ncbi:hypothetical protein KJ966_15995 [bacterium]|nr:hypothetical protein [bacterium]
MINQIVKRISSELEKFAKHNISIDRALDLIEASTKELDELVAINTMRESLSELNTKSPKLNISFPEVATPSQMNQTGFLC